MEVHVLKELSARVSSYQGGSSFLTMKGGHDEMKNWCGFYSKLGYCEAWGG